MGLLKWALIRLLISLVAGAFGYTGLARGAAQISKILFFRDLDFGDYRRRDHLLKLESNLMPR